MSSDKPTPLIIGFVSDLMFTSQIESVTRRTGYDVRWIGTADELSSGAASTRRPGEALHGQAAALMRQLTELQPALLLFDLGNDHIPWRNWIAKLKSSPATRLMPILCFGSHVDTDAFQAARSAGAEGVVARGRFVSAMPDLLAQYARIPDYAGVSAACAEPLSDLGREGIALFNAGEFYEAHHGLEAAWMEDQGAGRDFYRAILQIAVAYYQIQRGNYNGAVKMFLRVRKWLEPLPDVCRGVDVARLRRDADDVYTALMALGRDEIGRFDTARFQPVHFVDAPA